MSKNKQKKSQIVELIIKAILAVAALITSIAQLILALK